MSCALLNFLTGIKSLRPIGHMLVGRLGVRVYMYTHIHTHIYYTHTEYVCVGKRLHTSGRLFSTSHPLLGTTFLLRHPAQIISTSARLHEL